MELSANAQAVMEERYYKKDEKGKVIENFGEVCVRVSMTTASKEKTTEDRNIWSNKYFDIMFNHDFLPNSPVLGSFGVNINPSGSACFVLPIEDSRRSIFGTLTDAVDIEAFGGGVGSAFSRLRPKGSLIKSTNGKASGPISFMKIYDLAIGDVIEQGGKRKGALMGVLNVSHPDILEFISCKVEEGILNNFNISVGITDEFMEALKIKGPFDLKFNGKVFKTLPASQIWDAIIKNAWKSAEPGVLFLDTINKNNPLKHLGEIESSNPCGEQLLLPYQSCILGSINVSNFTIGDWLKEPVTIDYKRLESVIETSVRMLDSIIDVNYYPIKQIDEMTKKTRNIGLGIMGLADLFIKMRVKYGSDESLKIAESLMSKINMGAYIASQKLGKEKGYTEAFDSLPADDRPKLRNGALTSIAPTGTLAIIANCSNGCEPVFKASYDKLCIDKTLDFQHPLWKEWNENNPGKDFPDYFITAMEIEPEKHIKMQAALQKFVDSGISKTINLPNSATIEDIDKAYKLAYKLGCKGVTVYRDGSREIQALTGNKKSTNTSEPELTFTNNPIIPVKKQNIEANILNGCTIQIPYEKKWYLTLNYLDAKPIEVFVNAGKSGSDVKSWTEAIGRLISLYLKEGGDINSIIKTLKNIHGKQTRFRKGWSIKSGPDAIAQALKNIIERCNDNIEKPESIKKLENGIEICPSCNNKTFIRTGGCENCINPKCDLFGKCG
jgi:ribonucleoside-diphosphate reductase alpha chain